MMIYQRKGYFTKYNVKTAKWVNFEAEIASLGMFVFIWLDLPQLGDINGTLTHAR